MPRYHYTPFPYQTPPELPGRRPDRRAGRRSSARARSGLPPPSTSRSTTSAVSVVVDDNDVVSVGSRAICWAKRTLEIFDRLGVGDRMLEKGVTWNVGRLFHRENGKSIPSTSCRRPATRFPAFINLQQYYVEEYLVERCADFPDLIDLRWKNKVVDRPPVARHGDRQSRIRSRRPMGRTTLEAQYLIACDGARSSDPDHARP